MAKAGDSKSILSYSHYLVMKAQLIGNLCFDGHRPSEEENRVAEQCRSLCGIISRSLNICKINEVPNLLDHYDIIYRIGNKCVPDNLFISAYKRRVLDAWKSGDKRIDESSVYGMIIPEVVYHPEKADRDYQMAYQAIRRKWIATLNIHSRFPDVTAYENYQRLALIMRDNLGKEFGAKANEAKRKWYEQNKIEDFSTVGSLILRSYRRFASSLFPSIFNHKAVLDIDNRILTELSGRPDLTPYDRQASALALEFNKKFLTA